MTSPRVYATVLWLMSELFEELPEVGDLDRPKLVFFDEAHLLFNDASPRPWSKIAQVVRLDLVQGRRHLFHQPEPARHPR
ncbi:MAG: helicase HerA-like domain-containing protein [Alphaproteobacteria bacterium]